MNLQYVARIGILSLVLVVLLFGRTSERWTDVVSSWSQLRFEVRMFAVVLFGWPLIGYVTPVLIDFWKIVVANVTGLGGRYVERSGQNALLLLLLAVVGVQTIVVVVKLNSIDNQLTQA
jgi:hypothetical protein